MGHLSTSRRWEDVHQCLGLRPGPRLVPGRRRGPALGVLQHPVLLGLDVMRRRASRELWRLHEHRKRHGQREDQNCVARWLSDSGPPRRRGHISTWETGVTDMWFLFCADDLRNPAYQSSRRMPRVLRRHRRVGHIGVTTMLWMFCQRLGLQPGPRLVRGRRRGPGLGVLRHPVRVGDLVASWGGCDIPSNGNVMANGKIRIAVAAWLSDATPPRTRTATSRRLTHRG